MKKKSICKKNNFVRVAIKLIMPQFLSPLFFKNSFSKGIDFIEQTDLVIAKNCKIILELTQTMLSTLRKVHRVYKCCKIYCTESSKSKENLLLALGSCSSPV